MSEHVGTLLVLVVYFVLMRWVLPSLGFRT
jgi:hypothetical protein